MTLRIGTRGSRLALCQSQWVASRLDELRMGQPRSPGASPSLARLEVIRTEGDRSPDADLAESPERGIFTREIETALLEGRVDLAVHSLKDLPTRLPVGLVIAAVPARAEVSDLLLVRPDAIADRDDLPIREGARVGTGSPRRHALLRWLRPDLVTGPFRGNVPTRVAKCARGEVDAIVLARAGIDRLALDVAPLVAFELDPAAWLPAPGQGALALEARADDDATRARVQRLHDARTSTSVGLERELLALLEAGCHAALGAWARRDGDSVVLSAGVLGPDGRWHRAGVTGQPSMLVPAIASLLESAPPAEPPRGVARPL